MINPEDRLPINDPTFKSDNSIFTARQCMDGSFYFYDEDYSFVARAVLGDAIQEPAQIQAILPIAEALYKAGLECGQLQGRWHLAYQIKGLLGIPPDIEDRLTKLENP